MKNIIPYFPYKLKVMWEGLVCEVEGCDLHKKDTLIIERVNVKLSDIKPILRPLSDLTKEIEVNGEKFENFTELLKHITGYEWVYFQEEQELHECTYGEEHNGNKYDSIEELPYYLVEKLFEWHFDVFGLIEKGLAIDINTLKIADKK